MQYLLPALLEASIAGVAYRDDYIALRYAGGGGQLYAKGQVASPMLADERAVDENGRQIVDGLETEDDSPARPGRRHGYSAPVPQRLLWRQRRTDAGQGRL